MQDAFYRLCFKAAVPAYEVFEVCRVPDDAGYDADRVKSIAKSIETRSEKCDDCVDKFFTMPWVWRLLHSGLQTRRDAHTCLCDVLASLRITSTLVEKKHPLGQEAKPKKRGVAIECDQLGPLVFKSLVRNASDAHNAEAERRALEMDSDLLRQFKLCLKSSDLARHTDRRTEAAAKAKVDGGSKAVRSRAASLLSESSSTRRLTRAYDVYVTQNYSNTLEGNTVFE